MLTGFSAAIFFNITSIHTKESSSKQTKELEADDLLVNSANSKNWESV